jgi:hypothetical protein
MSMHVLWPSPSAVSCHTASYVSVPERETTPMRPGLCTWPGMMPILHSPGVMMPGQLGPMSVASYEDSARRTVIISITGMCSVMHTTSLQPASSASRIASAANAEGTKMHDVSAPCCFTASATVS